MFNTDLNHFLQQFDYAWLKLFLEFISAMGTVPFVLVFIFGITFILNFRKGVVLVNIVAWTVLFSVIAKNSVDFPRPIDVDTTLISDDYTKVNHQLKNQLPETFTKLLSPEVLSITRNDNQLNFGFPSGHTSIQVALWLGMFFLFRKRWILILGISLILVTMLSRLYLAHHFLGDVLGGLILGMIVVGLLGLVIIRSHFFKQLSPDFKSLTILWLPLTAIPFVSYIPVWVLGTLLAFNTTATLIILQGNTLIFSRNTFRRILSGLVIISLLSAVYYFFGNFSVFKNVYLQLLSITALNFTVFTSSVYVLKKVNFFQYKL